TLGPVLHHVDPAKRYVEGIVAEAGAGAPAVTPEIVVHTGAAIEKVVAGPADLHIDTAAAEHRVVAVAAIFVIVPVTAEQRVVPVIRAPDDPPLRGNSSIISGSTIDPSPLPR